VAENVAYFKVLPLQFPVTNKKRRVRFVGQVACMGRMNNTCTILAGQPEGKRPFGRHSHIWKNNIKIYIKQTKCEDVAWIQLSQY
jgi:hypothetical protein